MEYIKLLDEIADRYQHILKENLVGIYVHGSIAFGCYNPKKSDIDFLVVVKEAPDLCEKEKLIQVLMELSKDAPQKGLEMSVVKEEVCRHFIYPTPFELHFSNMHRQKCEENLKEYCETMNGTDIDLVAHFTVTRHVGFALIGKPVLEIFGEVPKEYYLDSIKCDIESATEEVKENPVYIILNLCRVLAFIADEKVLSKEQGGRWGIQHVPDKYIPLIEAALSDYSSQKDQEDPMIYEEAAEEFCSYMTRCIFKTEY